MEDRGYGILDFEDIWNMAHDLVYTVTFEGMMLDDEGNFVGCPKNQDEWLETRKTDLRFKYLNFRECEEFNSITLAEASDLFCNEIMEKYLSEAVPFIRTVMRKGSLTPCQFVKEEVPDDYLNQVICTAWKVDLIIWTKTWERNSK